MAKVCSMRPEPGAVVTIRRVYYLCGLLTPLEVPAQLRVRAFGVPPFPDDILLQSLGRP